MEIEICPKYAFSLSFCKRWENGVKTTKVVSRESVWWLKKWRRKVLNKMRLEIISKKHYLWRISKWDTQWEVSCWFDIHIFQNLSAGNILFVSSIRLNVVSVQPRNVDRWCTCICRLSTNECHDASPRTPATWWDISQISFYLCGNAVRNIILKNFKFKQK